MVASARTDDACGEVVGRLAVGANTVDFDLLGMTCLRSASAFLGHLDSLISYLSSESRKDSTALVHGSRKL